MRRDNQKASPTAEKWNSKRSTSTLRSPVQDVEEDITVWRQPHHVSHGASHDADGADGADGADADGIRTGHATRPKSQSLQGVPRERERKGLVDKSVRKFYKLLKVSWVLWNLMKCYWWCLDCLVVVHFPECQSVFRLEMDAWPQRLRSRLLQRCLPWQARMFQLYRNIKIKKLKTWEMSKSAERCAKLAMVFRICRPPMVVPPPRPMRYLAQLSGLDRWNEWLAMQGMALPPINGGYVPPPPPEPETKSDGSPVLFHFLMGSWLVYHSKFQ